MEQFKLVSDYTPKGDQPEAIDRLTDGILENKKGQVLLGVTGSGKTFTMAHVIARVNKPTLVMAPNKTLAAQLYHEFKEVFPENAVEYFVSYYDYYQPEAYIPTTDTYIAKDSAINDMIDKLRHSATRSVLTRNDVLVVASVSCIYGLGAPEDYLKMRVEIEVEMEIGRDKLLSDLIVMHYERNDMDFHRGTFRVRGDCVEIFPAYEEAHALRVDFFGDTIDGLTEFDPLTGHSKRELRKTAIYPASHYVTEKAKQTRAAETIMAELKERIAYFRGENKLIETQRIEERTMYDMEMIREIGYCNGIENYSRHFTGREKGAPPPTLLEYFPDDFLMIIDESHIAVSQIHAMYKGDRSRKQTLVNFGFRLPSALDNRPLKFEEWQKKIHQVVFVSATPAEYEFEFSNNCVVEQIVRPTGLIDPVITIHSASHQVDDLLDRIKERIQKNERVLVTTLTKRMAEDLAEYYADLGIAVKYLHSDIHTLERMEIIKDLRMGKFDVLIGINLLREGLDIPEVSLVAIMDADKEGFLRSVRSLIQTFGRAARNEKGEVMLYADKMTKSMEQAIEETTRRRKIQEQFNKTHQLTPKTIKKHITDIFDGMSRETKGSKRKRGSSQMAEKVASYGSSDNLEKRISALEKEMKKAAKQLDFEHAADLRDEIALLKKRMVFDGLN